MAELIPSLKVTMKKLIFILILAAGAVYGQNSNKPVLAYCTLEKGCTFCQSEYSYKDIDSAFNYLGTYEKDKGILTFFTNKDGEDRHYPDRTRSVAQLHAYFGGKGAAMTMNACPIPFGAIQPRDGNWSIDTSTPQTSNCPKGVAEELKKVKMFESGPKVFSKPFKPTDLLDVSEINWFATNTNRYRGVFNGAIGGFNTIYDVKILTPDSMKGNLSFEVKIPGQPLCKVNMDFTYTRTE